MSARKSVVGPVRLERFYLHPVEKVFRAFSEESIFARWIAPSKDITTKILKHQFYQGGEYQVEFDIPDAGTRGLSGEFVSIQDDEQVCFTWLWAQPDIHAGVKSLVTAEFFDQAGGTKLVITHEQLPESDQVQRHSKGWSACLTRLDNLLNRRPQWTTYQ